MNTGKKIQKLITGCLLLAILLILIVTFKAMQDLPKAGDLHTFLVITGMVVIDAACILAGFVSVRELSS